MRIPADVFNAAVKKLRAAEAARPKTRCPKCDKETIEVRMHPEAAADMAAVGYDGTCCWKGFDILRLSDEELLSTCPTCGSDDPSVRYVIAPLGNGGERECDDSWHDDSCESENRV